MIVARRDMASLNGKPVVAGQVLDSIWPTLRERTRRVLVRGHYVEDVAAGTEPEGPVSWATTARRDVEVVRVQEGGKERAEFRPVAAPKKRGRKPKPAAQANA